MKKTEVLAMKNPYLPLRFVLIRALACAAVFLGLMTAGLMAGEAVELQILHINDFHGYLLPYEDKALAPLPEKIGGAAFIASKIRELRALNPEGTLTLDAGDIAQGTPLSNEFRGKPVVEYMSALGFDAMELGNHEFDWGVPVLREMVAHASFPVLCANIVEEKTGKPLPFVSPYHVFTRKGVRIGIIGLITPQTPRISNPLHMKGLRFLPPEEVAARYRDELKAQGVQVVGLLSHCGVDADKELAARVPGIAFIIGGHSHTALKDPLVVNGTIIVQARAYGMYLGDLTFSVDRDTGKVLSFKERDELIPIVDRDITADPAVVALLEPYVRKIQPVMKEVVGFAREEIPKVPLPGRGDSAMGDLVADLLREYSGTEVFFINSGALRMPFYRGKITREDVYRMFPFEDVVVTVSLAGSAIKAVLEHGVLTEKVIQVSGVSFAYRRGAQGTVQISEVMVGGRPLDDRRLYRVGTIDYLYHGGDGYMMFQKGRNPRFGEASVRDIIGNCIKSKVTIGVPSDARVLLSGEPPGRK
ncbi:MAG: bifunctional UDP-sugar hydrolase/5'-nucleotidase [Candidatus Eremiobacteraeota bacterium]|nr:bifunctional UDP-sugar hydrolase/5'-nucleotidase [Candidatus Eremiobacteraeota bacterium]